MIADSGTAFATGSIEWEGVLVGALDCAVDQHSSGVNPVLVVLSRVVPTVNHLQATLPDGAAWGSGSGEALAGVLSWAAKVVQSWAFAGLGSKMPANVCPWYQKAGLGA